MVHRGKKLLSNRSGCVWNAVVFTNLWLLSVRWFQDFTEHLSFPDGVVKNKNSWSFFFSWEKRCQRKWWVLLRMQPELKVYRTDFHWLEYLKRHGILVLGHCGEVRSVPIRWRLFAVWWAQNLAFQHDIGLICSIYFFLSVWSVWWFKWNLTNKFCESQLFFGNLPAILGTMFWVWSPDFETRLSRDSETDSKRKPEMRPWPCRLAECLMNLEVVVQFSERNLAVNKSLACHSWSALQCVICQRHCLRWTVWSHWVCRWTGKVSEGSLRHVWVRLTSQRPCRHAPNIGVENGMKLTSGGLSAHPCWWWTAKPRPKQDPVIPKRPACRRWNEWFVVFTGAPGDVLEMCWRWVCWISEMLK